MRPDHFTNQELKDWQRHFTDKFSKTLAWHNRTILEMQTVDASV